MSSYRWPWQAGKINGEAREIGYAVTTKEDLRRLLHQLPESELVAARRFLECLRDTGDPVLRAFLEAPEDDEPET